MGQVLRIQKEGYFSFITNKTVGDRFLFKDNKVLSNEMLGILAKNQVRHEAKYYGFVMMDNHIHLLSYYPKLNRASFMRDFSSAVAKSVKRNVRGCPKGAVWGKRYACQMLLNQQDVFEYLFYVILNPVRSGIVRDLKEHPSYQLFLDMISGTVRNYDNIEWGEFKDKVRFNPKLNVKDCTREYPLVFDRLPGFEKLSDKEYYDMMLRELEIRTAKAVKEREELGKGFISNKTRKKIKPLDRPKNVKKSNKVKLIILTACNKTRKEFHKIYDSIRAQFTKAYLALKHGIEGIPFPGGTHHPPLMWVFKENTS